MADPIESQVAATAQPAADGGNPQPQAAGAVGSQPGTQAGKAETGTTENQGQTPEKPITPKTYTDEDVAKIKAELTSKLQSETEQYKKYASQLAMQQRLAQMQDEERQAESRDAQDVANGVITQEDAAQRKKQRLEISQLQQTAQMQRQQADNLGRVLLAHDLAKQYGIEADKLLKDQALSSPTLMIQKAAELAIRDRDEKLRKAQAVPENFDKGTGEIPHALKSESQRLRERYPTMFKK